MIKLKYQELSCLKETHFIKNKEYLDQKKKNLLIKGLFGWKKKSLIVTVFKTTPYNYCSLNIRFIPIKRII